MPKVVFVAPASRGINCLPLPPLGMLWVAAYLRQHGIQVDAIDMSLEKDDAELLKKIEWADIVGISGTSSHQFEDAKRIAALAQRSLKMTVFGGIHATVKDCESAKYFDVVVRGEGEETMLEICKQVGHHPATTSSFGYMRGITYRNRIGCIVQNPDRIQTKDIHSYPFPARDLIPPTRYPQRELTRFSGRYTSILGARGCPNKCIFCASPAMWHGARLRSADNIYHEMIHVYKEYGIKNFHFHDDTFTLDESRVYRLCGLIVKGPYDFFRWSCITRPDKVNMKMMLYMKAAGCVQIEIGAESASNRLLRTARKGYTANQVKRAFQIARVAGLRSYAYFIIGLPGETVWTWLMTMLFAKRLKADSCVFTVLSPFPGTEAYEKNMVKILKRDCWLYKEPVVQVGMLTPRMLAAMRKIADILVNGLGYHGAYKKKQTF